MNWTQNLNRLEWKLALLSGNYPQGACNLVKKTRRGVLFSPYGVLVQLYINERLPIDIREEEHLYYFDGLDSTLPPCVAAWAGVTELDVPANLPFKEFAELIKVT